MARYKVEGKKIIADITKLKEKDIKAINNYLALGYELEEPPKPKSITVDEMRDALSVDAEALKEFNKIYGTKAVKGETAPFFKACKFYNDWKKKHK